jgi:glutamate-5-semialdehyde dehydrogenase
MHNTLDGTFDSLKKAGTMLALASGAQKDAALRAAARALREAQSNIARANARDVRAAEDGGMKAALVDRLLLNSDRIEAMAAGIEAIARLDDPIGRVLDGWTRPNGLFIEKITVPLGVAAIIYESRPNVTADAFALAYKAGCPILLRGSSAALNSNRAIVEAIKSGLAGSDGICEAIALADSGDRAEVDEILQARGKIDVVLPRGGHDLIRRVVENARVPVIQTGEGNCHIYVEPDADMQNAAEIIYNAKIQRPGACNAVETVLIHKDAVQSFMPILAARLSGLCALRCDARSKAAALADKSSNAETNSGGIQDATEADWQTEFLDFILAVKTVDSIDEAITHINHYGTGHSEAILSGSLASAERFTREVDAACVYVNASTRFTDGGEFGFGAELGISTQKFHARGPMGLDALTTIKYRIRGNGHVRGC